MKDLYGNFSVFNNDLKLRWKGEGQTGHFPYPYDVDGDRRLLSLPNHSSNDLKLTAVGHAIGRVSTAATLLLATVYLLQADEMVHVEPLAVYPEHHYRQDA